MTREHSGRRSRRSSTQILRLSDPRFYNRREVKFGYMRGSETYQYVESIRHRWTEYRRVAKPERTPQKAKGERKKKFR